MWGEAQLDPTSYLSPKYIHMLGFKIIHCELKLKFWLGQFMINSTARTWLIYSMTSKGESFWRSYHHDESKKKKKR